MTKLLKIIAPCILALAVVSALSQHSGAATASTARPPAVPSCRPVVHVRTVTKTRIVTKVKVVTRVVYRTRTVTVVKVVPAPTATPIPAPAHAALHNGVVVQASTLHQISTDGLSAPPAGQQYVIVHVTITNQGAQSTSYNALDFQLQDATDHVRHAANLFASNAANAALNNGSLAAGQAVAGDITFEVPATENSFTLLWTPDLFGDSITVPIT